MAKYSEEFKYSIIMKMMPPQNQAVSMIARETGLSEGTLHQWRKQARAKGFAVPSGEQEVERWSTQDKFLIVVETSHLSTFRRPAPHCGTPCSSQQIERRRNPRNCIRSEPT